MNLPKIGNMHVAIDLTFKKPIYYQYNIKISYEVKRRCFYYDFKNKYRL